jgi:excinuclease UvrABC ATPase subunit
VRAEYDKIFTRKTCPVCQGARLNAAALDSRIKGKNIAELSAMQVSDLAPFVRSIVEGRKPSVDEVTAAASRLIHSLTTHAPPRDREEEARKAQLRSRKRFTSP